MIFYPNLCDYEIGESLMPRDKQPKAKITLRETETIFQFSKLNQLRE